MTPASLRSTQPTKPDNRFHRTSAKEAALLMVMAAGVGLVSALPAVALNLSVHGATQALAPWHGHWTMILLPAAGAALSAWYIRGWLKDDLGHGVPEMIRSASLGGGRLPLSMVWSRLLASFLTVGSGGSSGLEGPIATSGGAIGSSAGRMMSVNERRRVHLMGYGVAGAVAAIFNAPLTGMVFALEVILREWNALTILPTIVAAVTATQVSRLVMGNQIAFQHEQFHFATADLVACVLLGAAAGGLSVLLARGLSTGEFLFKRLRWPAWATAGFGGLLVGLIGWVQPAVLHDGYEAIKTLMTGGEGFTPAILAAFIVLKFISVVFTLGSGGAGGVFAPSLVLGSTLGFGFGRLAQTVLPGMFLASESAFALVGMAGMVAGVMHGPLTGMFLVLETTGGYHMILPVMITTVTAMLVSYFFEEGSVYTRELIRRGHLASKGSDQHLLQTMELKELMDQKQEVLHEGMLLGEFVDVFKRAKRNIFPVVDKKNHHWLGVVYLDDIRPYLFDRSLYPIMTMGEVMHTNLPVIDVAQSLRQAVAQFESSGAWSLPVVEDGIFIGMMSKSNLFDRYRQELIVHTTG
ncbi:MAG: chloride channel protein [Deltaproteobacteria bacterium]|nr:chloride channel protein [Deltaproteobacteria bacterium]